MGYTAFYNPTTGEKKVYDNVNLTGSEINALKSQGWVSVFAGPYNPSPALLDYFISKSPNVSQEAEQNLAQTAASQEAYIAGLQQAPSVQALTPLSIAVSTPKVTEIPVKVPADIGVSQQEWDRLGSGTKQAILTKNIIPAVDIETYNHMSLSDQEKVVSIVPKKVSSEVYSRLGPGARKYAERQLSIAEKVKGGVMLAAEFAVPGLMTARHWKELSPAEKALFIVIDVISVLPLPGAAVRGARAAFPQTSRLARITGAAKGAGREVVTQIRAPVDLVIHPIESIKGAGRGIKMSARNIESLMENIANPKKIPEAVITTSDGTVRFPVHWATNEAQANAIRNKIMVLGKRNEPIFVEMGNVRVEVPRSPLMKKVGGGLAHATPQGTAWEFGGKVAVKPGVPGREQGLFFSHEPLPRFVLSTAYGKTGEKPVFIIISKETAEKAISSEKIYRHTAELESKLPVGSIIFEPKQRLFTRVGPMQERAEIWLEEPLTAWQIAELKAESLVYSIRTLGEPSIKIRNFKGTLTRRGVDELADIIGKSDRELAERLRRTARAIERGRYAPPSLARILGRRGSVAGESGMRMARSEARERARPRITERERARETTRTEREEPRREPTRETPRRGERGPTREPERTPPRREERIPPREGGRIPPRDGERVPPRDGGRVPPREPPIEPPPKKGDGEIKIQVKEVEGIPKHPGIVEYDMGFERISVLPPYKIGPENVKHKHLKNPTEGEGSEQATLRVYDGDPPKKLVLTHGWKETTILRGQELQNTIIRPRGRGVVMGMDGRTRKTRKRVLRR